MKNFEDFLQDKHAETYTGTDDEMPDNFEQWESELDVHEYVNFANEYASQVMIETKEKMMKAFQPMVDLLEELKAKVK